LSVLKRENTNYKKQSIGIVIAAAMVLLLLAGTILAPTQTSVLSKFNTNTGLKHGIRDGVGVKLEHRDQHMNQENLCYRTNTRRQSNDGQNTLGNDNSVTGFADQSDNLKQATAANKTTPTTTTTPANQTTGSSTTPTPTSTRTPTTTPTPTPTPGGGCVLPGVSCN
jgi:cell division protein FtsN